MPCVSPLNFNSPNIFLFCQIYREKISSKKIVAHIKIMNDLRWIDFAGEGMKPPIDFLKNEVRILCKLLHRHKDKLSGNLNEKVQGLLNPESASKKNAVTTAFKNALRTVPLSDKEFHSEIDHPFTKKMSSRGRPGDFQKCVNAAVANVISQIKGRKFYDPMFLTDNAMNIEEFGKACNTVCLDSQKRSTFREAFRKKLAEGEAGLKFHIYGKVNGNYHVFCFAFFTLLATCLTLLTSLSLPIAISIHQ